MKGPVDSSAFRQLDVPQADSYIIKMNVARYLIKERAEVAKSDKQIQLKWT